MLDDDAGGHAHVELAHGSPRGIGVEVIVVAELLALQLLGRSEGVLVGLRGRTRNAHALALVERSVLVGIFAVAKIGLLVKDDALVLPERTLLDQLVVQPGVDGVVIGTREAEDLEGQDPYGS